MTDTQYKVKSLLGLDIAYPAIGLLRPMAPCRWAPFGAVMRAQDTIPASSRRVVAEYSLSGAEDFDQPNGSVNPGTIASPTGQFYPTDNWRTLGTFYSRITPGCELRANILYTPAGLVQKLIASTYVSDGAWAEVRVGVTWTGPGATAGPIYHAIACEGSASGTYGGGQPTVDGGDWVAIREQQITGIRPPGVDLTPATAEDYSEWSDAAITLAIRGGARVIHIVVYEVPLLHVSLHSDAGELSVHAMPAGLAPQTPIPMESAPDGATYQEHRFGTVRLAQVAARQSERLGPRILHWTAYTETDTDMWGSPEALPATVTSTSLVELVGSGSLGTPATSYLVDGRGWIVGGAHAQLHRLCDPSLIMRQQGSIVPVRVRVDATMTGGTGTVRVQCGLYEWVDVTVTGARGVYTHTGYLESQVHDDDDAPAAMLFGRVTAGTLEVYSVSVDFGSW